MAISLSLLGKAAPIVLPLAATYLKFKLPGAGTLLNALGEKGIEVTAELLGKKFEALLQEEPGLLDELGSDPFLVFQGEVMGALIRRFGEMPQFAGEKKVLLGFADQAREGWLTKTDRVRPSERTNCHCRPVAIWQILRRV